MYCVFSLLFVSVDPSSCVLVLRFPGGVVVLRLSSFSLVGTPQLDFLRLAPGVLEILGVYQVLMGVGGLYTGALVGPLVLMFVFRSLMYSLCRLLTFTWESIVYPILYSPVTYFPRWCFW